MADIIDDDADAFAEARRIRPFYPDAHALDAVLYVGKSLPERKPRTRPPGDQEDVAGIDDQFCFSGWGGDLTHAARQLGGRRR